MRQWTWHKHDIVSIFYPSKRNLLNITSHHSYRLGFNELNALAFSMNSPFILSLNVLFRVVVLCEGTACQNIFSSPNNQAVFQAVCHSSGAIRMNRAGSNRNKVIFGLELFGAGLRSDWINFVQGSGAVFFEGEPIGGILGAGESSICLGNCSSRNVKVCSHNMYLVP